MKKILLTLLLCGIVGTTFSQEEDDNSLLVFLHGGCGFLPSKTSGLTSSSPSYVDELSVGAIWNAQAYFRHKMLITGLLYSGYTANGSLAYSSDRILTTYLAPQLGMDIPIADRRVEIAFNAGIGSMWYRNYSVVFEKDRNVKKNTIGLNFGLKGVYNFTPHFGVSLEMSAITASVSSVEIQYHDYNTLKVNYADPLYLNQINFAIGLKYSL